MKGEHGWVGLALYVLLWDRYAPETLSRAFWRALRHPRKRWVVLAAWAWVTSHLIWQRPAKVLYWI